MYFHRTSQSFPLVYARSRTPQFLSYLIPCMRVYTHVPPIWTCAYKHIIMCLHLQTHTYMRIHTHRSISVNEYHCIRVSPCTPAPLRVDMLMSDKVVSTY